MLLLLVGVLGPGIFLLARHHMAQNWSTMNSPDLKTSSRIQSNREWNDSTEKLQQQTSELGEALLRASSPGYS